MEENTNKQIRISGTTVFFIFVLIIGLAAFFGYEWHNLKNGQTEMVAKEKSQEVDLQKLEDEINKLKEENDKLKKFVFDEVGEDIWAEYITFDDIVLEKRPTYNSKKIERFEEAEFEKLLNDYVSVSTLYYTSPEDLLIKLGLTDEEKIYDYADEVLLDEYYITDIKFEDYRNAMLQYMSLDTFEEDFSDVIKSYQGNVCYSSYWSEDSESDYMIVSMKRTEYSDEVEFEVEIKSTTIEYIDDEEYVDEYSEVYYFEFTTCEDKLVVDYTDFSY